MLKNFNKNNRDLDLHLFMDLSKLEKNNANYRFYLTKLAKRLKIPLIIDYALCLADKVGYCSFQCSKCLYKNKVEIEV